MVVYGAVRKHQPLMNTTRPLDPLAERDPELTRRLRRNLRAAHAVAQRLPDAPDIALYLINPDFRSERLSAEETRAIIQAPAYWAFCWASGQVLARFRQRARRVLVADSRVRDFAEPGYRCVFRAQSSTWPNLDEFDEFRRVAVYAAGGSSMKV